MANVTEEVEKIANARYGREVRGSICSAILAMNDESEEAISKAITAQDSATASAQEAEASKNAAKTSEDIARQYAALSKGETAISTDTTHELETGEGGIKLNKVVGKSYKSKNLIPYPYKDGNTKTTNGITYTVNADKSISASGTASGAAYYYLKTHDVTPYFNIPKGKYKLVGCPSGGGTSTYNVTVRLFKDTTGIISFVDTGNGVVFDTTSYDYNRLLIYINMTSGQAVSQAFKPMITTDLTATYSDYEPYGLFNSGDSGEIVVEEHNEGSTETHTTIIPLTEPLYEQNVIDVEKGVIEKKYIRVHLKDLTWKIDSDGQTTSHRAYANGQIVKCSNTSSGVVGNLFCSHLEAKTGGQTWNNQVGISCQNNNVQIRVDGCLTVQDYTNWLNANDPVFIYELSTPTTEPLTDAQIKALHSLKSYDGKTFVDTSDVYAKATLSLEYASHRVGALALLDYNLAKINELISADNSIISDKWVQKTYQPNDFCIYEDSLWKCLVTNSLAPSEGANWTRVKVTDAFKRPQLDYANKQGWNYGSYTVLSDGMIFVGVYMNPDGGGAISVSIQGFLALSVASSPFGNSVGSCYVAKGEIVNIDRQDSPHLQYIYFVPFK